LSADAKLDPASGYYYRSLSLKLVFPGALITKIEITDYTLLGYAFVDSTIYLGDSQEDNDYKWQKSWTGYHGGHATPEFAQAATQISWHARCDRDTNITQLGGIVQLFGMKVYGRGNNPFV
jgi:hypothetical protein